MQDLPSERRVDRLNPLGMIKVDSSMCISAQSEGSASEQHTVTTLPSSHQNISPRRLSRMASLPAPQYFTQDQVIRVNCLYVSRKLLRNGAGDALSLSNANSAPMMLAPGLQASAQVVKASKAVKAYQVFDLKLSSQPRLSDLESEVRRHLCIPLGVEVEMKILPVNGDHATKISTDQQLSAALAVHHEEITIQVMKSGIRLYLPWIAILVSLADAITTIYYAGQLLKDGNQTQTIIGSLVLGSTLLAIMINLTQAFLHMKRSILINTPTHEWVTVHVCETALGLMLSGFNILNLECLWSHFDVGKRMNFHCPMPASLQRMSGKNSIPALILGDGVSIAASIYDMINSSHVEWYIAASVGTSCASLALSVIKKVIVVLFIAADVEGESGAATTAHGAGNHATLQRRSVTLARFSLNGLTDLQQRPRLLAALSCRLHDLTNIAVRAHGGTVISFTESSIDAVFNAPRECSQPALKATKTALQLIRQWKDAREAILGHKKDTFFNVTAAIVSDEAFFGNLGPLSRKELKVVGAINQQLEDLTGLAHHEEIAILVNSNVQAEAHRDGILVRQVDIIRDAATGAHSAVYQVLDPHGKLAKQWGGIAVSLWSSLFGAMSSGTVPQCLDILAEYAKAIESDHVAESLGLRLARYSNRGAVRYWRDRGVSVWSDPPEPEAETSVSPHQQTHSMGDIVPVMNVHQGMPPTMGYIHPLREWSTSPPCYPPTKQLPSSMSPSPHRMRFPSAAQRAQTMSVELRDVRDEDVAETLGLNRIGEAGRVNRPRGIGSCISVNTVGGSSENGMTWSRVGGSSFCLTSTGVSRVSSALSGVGVGGVGGGSLATLGSAGAPPPPSSSGASLLATPEAETLDMVSSVTRVKAYSGSIARRQDTLGGPTAL